MADRNRNPLVWILLRILFFERRVLGGKFNAGIFFLCLFAMLETYAPPPLDFWFQGNYQFENDRQGLGFLLEHLYGFACALSVVELYKEYPKWRARRKQK